METVKSYLLQKKQYIFCVAVVCLVSLLLGPAVVGFASYIYFLSSLVFLGGLNAWLAQAIGIAFAGGIFLSVRHAVSRKRTRRTVGFAGLIFSAAAFHLVVYAVAPRANDGSTVSATLAGSEQNASARRKGASESEKPNAEGATSDGMENEWREAYVNDLSGHPLAHDSRALMLLVKGQPDQSHSDFVRGELVQIFEERGQKTVANMIKPAFFASGHFDQLWGGHSQLVRQLGLEDAGFPRLLLARVEFSEPTNTDFEGFVSVRGTLSLLLVSAHGARGPWIYTVAGAGTDKSTALINCGSRLVELAGREKLQLD